MGWSELPKQVGFGRNPTYRDVVDFGIASKAGDPIVVVGNEVGKDADTDHY